MKKTSIYFLAALAILATSAHGQGWYAEIDLDLNHDYYAFENISNATLTFSGVTVSGSSTNSNLKLVVKGTGSLSGSISLTVKGTGFEPYDRSDPYSAPILVQYSGKYNTLCKTGFFQKAGEYPNSQLYIWVKIYPRLAISTFTQLCDQITLTTPTCSPKFFWEVSDSPTGNFRTLEGKSTSTIVVTRQELISLGFASTYGRKYFRVTGLPNTTSALQPVEIYYPGPTASIQVSPPKCHDGADGSITVNIQSPLPSDINDFVVTIFKGVPPEGQFLQDFVNDNFQKTFTGLKAGSYWVRIENNSSISIYGNCWTDYSAGNLVNPEPVIVRSEVSSYNGFGVSCAGGNNGSIKVISSGGSGSFTKFEWTPQVSTTSIASNLRAGQFQVKVSDSHGCPSETLTTVVTEPKHLAVQLLSTGGKNGYDVSCYNKSDGELIAEVSGGVGGYKYLWSNRNATSSISDLPPGAYSVQVTDGNGCLANATITLAAPSPIDFAIEEINGINCPGDKTGILEIVSPINTIGQTFYSWSSGETGKTITDKGSGTYTAAVSDEQGCSTAKSHKLSEAIVHTAEIIAVSDFNGEPIRCNGTATGQLQAIVRDATGRTIPGQEFTWYRNGTLYQSGQYLETLKEVDAGTYRAKIRYTTYCSAEATYVLNEPDPLIARILPLSDYNGVPIRCNGSADGSLKAEASGGVGEASFLWNTSDRNALVTGLPEGTYEVTATDKNGCSAHASATLADPNPVEVSIAILSDYHGAALSCADASDGRLRATANGGTGDYAYVWSTGQTGIEVTNIYAGTHSVTATDVNGCQGRNESVVVAPAPLAASIEEISDYHGYGTSCAGTHDGFIRAAGSGGTGAYRYHWPETGATTSLNADLAKGQYTVIIYDDNGCSASAEASLSAPDPVTLSASSVKHVSCYDGSDGAIELTATGGTGIYMYSLQGSEWQTDRHLENLKAAVYYPNVQDNNGCSDTDAYRVTQPLPLAITFTDVAAALCGVAIGKISATVTGGTAGYQYAWTDANANVVSTDATASTLDAGIYYLTVTDTHGCQTMSTAGITSTDGPVIEVARITGTSCSYTADGKAVVQILSGDGPFTFLWQDGQATAEGIQLKKGNHTVEVRDINNCAAVTSVIIPSPDSLAVDMISLKAPKCFGDCNGEISVLARGGTGPYFYDWGTSTGEQLTGICSGVYEVKLTDEKACIASRTFQVPQPDPLAIQVLSQASPVCPERCDGSIELQATGGTGDLTYLWSNGESGRLITDLCAERFTARITDSHGCAIEETLALERPEPRVLDLGGSVTLCEGQTHTLDAGADWKHHLWSANNGFKSESRTVTLREAAMYWLEATTAEGCTVRDTFLLQTSNDLLKASFLMPSKAAIGDTVVIIDISWPLPERIVWELPPAMNQLESPGDMIFGKFANPGGYDVRLTATLGACRDELTKTITILNEDSDLSEEGRLGGEPFVKQLTLFPNPNDGMFDLVVEFREESPIVVTVWNVLTSTRIARIDASPDTYHQQHIDLRPLSSGSYSLRLDYSQGTKYLRFIVR